MKRTPAPSARRQMYSKMLAVVVALLMLSMFRPDAGDGALYAFSASPEKVQQDACSHRGAAHALCAPTFKSSSGGRRTTPAGATTRPEVSCGTGWTGGTSRVAPKTNAALSVPSRDTSEACDVLYTLGHYLGPNYGEWQKGFDTLKHFIETCPTSADAPGAFNEASTDLVHVYGVYGGEMRAPYLEWLKSVLYLDTVNPGYFCADVEEIAGFLPIAADSAPGWYSRQTNVPLSVYHWLIMNTACDTPVLWQDYEQARKTQRQQWLNNPQAYKLDTTVYPISTWGLDTLFARHFLHQPSDGVKRGPDILASASINPNPSRSGTVLTLCMSQAAYVQVEVYDLLGNAVRAGGFEQYLGAGNHSVPIDLTTLASGTYYVRIVTAYGETRTVKIVRQ